MTQDDDFVPGLGGVLILSYMTSIYESLYGAQNISIILMLTALKN
jgi:hypothetical protein